ncbi:MAG TPA: phage terminase large subunit [Thermotogota bacterium]|nr:phage terminase large subunit [Thermotogota bacterium]
MQYVASPKEFDRVLYSRSFYDFLQTDGKAYWVDGEHLRIIAGKLQEVAEGKLKKMIVTLPPRHGKSELISKKFPAWYLLQNPNQEIIISTYSADLSYDFSRIARSTFSRHSELFDLQLAKDSQSVARWGIEGYRGGLVAAGVGGPITGRGFHVGIIDDPIKNREEANSDTIRKKIIEWYKSTFRTRAYPNAAQIIVQTRWHEADLTGVLLQEQPEEWFLLNLPAFAEDNDPIGRREGAPLWPERYSEHELLKIKKDIGTYEWLALYQQRPTALEGNIFRKEWFRYTGSIPKNITIYQTIDPAVSTKTEADYFVELTFGVDDKHNIYIIDLFRGKLEFPDQIRAIESNYIKWKPLRIGIESVAYQAALEQTLRTKSMLPVMKLRPSADKVTRALRVTPMFENGKVYIYDHFPNKPEFETELMQFPNGRHDDIVDSVSYIADMVDEFYTAEIYRVRW